MRIYKIISVLLEYPEQELMEHLPEIINWAKESPELDKNERTTLLSFVQQMSNKDLLELQEDYVNTFDMKAEHSLYLTHHLFGDDKNRGPALIDLGELYKDYGVEVTETVKELPDYLPLVLEFAAYLDSNESVVFLADAKKVFRVLMDNLKTADSPYAELIAIIVERANLTRIEAA